MVFPSTLYGVKNISLHKVRELNFEFLKILLKRVSQFPLTKLLKICLTSTGWSTMVQLDFTNKKRVVFKTRNVRPIDETWFSENDCKAVVKLVKITVCIIIISIYHRKKKEEKTYNNAVEYTFIRVTTTMQHSISIRSGDILFNHIIGLRVVVS